MVMPMVSAGDRDVEGSEPLLTPPGEARGKLVFFHSAGTFCCHSDASSFPRHVFRFTEIDISGIGCSGRRVRGDYCGNRRHQADEKADFDWDYSIWKLSPAAPVLVTDYIYHYNGTNYVRQLKDPGTIFLLRRQAGFGSCDCERSPVSPAAMQLFQGEEPAHDFLSLRAGGSSSSPSPFQHRNASSQGDLSPLSLLCLLRCHAVDGASPASSEEEEHVLPGGVGTFSIRQASGTPSREEAGSHGVVSGAFAPVLHGARMENAHETGSGSRAHRAPPTMLQDSATDQRSIAARGEGRSSASSADQGPSTPRSKHSATEQRRRTKINDRLEILRQLLPQCDQKRDKASFLSEVIEYIRFLQEKVQKYEASDPERNHEDTKSMPWAKVYYRSCWRNTQNISQVQGGELSPSTQDMNKEQYGSKSISVAPPAPFNTQSITSTTASSSHMAKGMPQNWTENSTPTNQPPWLSMSTMRQESESVNRMLNKERKTVHEDNHSLSSAYSQGLLNRLTEALKKSGVDPSQANISVEINMSKRKENTSDNSKTNEAEEPIHITKRPRCNKS
ncbi:hypothetical protein GUJ93_ZPchr0006g45830 [Zizania palustris]|uniref:BHLH domain-containing protein n=1 Tax=Zizania palustris TaxID=103762 RepID=A0A8J5SM35_ZIZPA|nr:hypothetical protein GUJ93_ZPchr0006g45830 [Zizania palustris]